MSVLKRKAVGYGLTQALPKLSPAPIIAKRAPTVNDKAEIGSTWVDKSANKLYTIVGLESGEAGWLAQEADLFAGSGAPTFAAAKGSIYSRTDGSSTSTRLYVCSVATGTWVSVTTSA